MTDPITQNPPETETPNTDVSRSQERIQQLSDKVQLTARERDEKEALIKERDAKIADLEKENSFNSGFADMLGNHPAAKDHKDEIKAKVLAGYTVEDATLAVLGKAGKLSAITPVTPQVAGGSATINPQSAQKEPKDMTQAERRDALEKLLVWQ